MKIQKYTKTSISILLTLLLSYWLVSAWTNLSSVTTWDTLTATVWNDMATKLNDAWQRASGIFTDGSGKVGIWTSSPKAHLHITNWSNYWAMILWNDWWTNNNAITHESNWDFVIWKWTFWLGIPLMSITPAWNMWIAWTLTQASDKRLKTNIDDINKWLDLLSKINGVTYNWKDKNKDQRLQYWVIAQEVEEVIPELVSEDDKWIKSVNYVWFTPVLIEAVKELKKQNDEKDKQIEKLSKQNEEILKRLEKLENK